VGSNGCDEEAFEDLLAAAARRRCRFSNQPMPSTANEPPGSTNTIRYNTTFHVLIFWGTKWREALAIELLTWPKRRRAVWARRVMVGLSGVRATRLNDQNMVSGGAVSA
jgi:hypothetical protein